MAVIVTVCPLARMRFARPECEDAQAYPSAVTVSPGEGRQARWVRRRPVLRLRYVPPMRERSESVSSEAPAVLLVGDALGHGGVESYIVNLANRLVSDGRPVAVQALAGGPLWSWLRPEVGRQEIRHTNLLLEAMVRARATRRHARRTPGLVVHSHQRIVAFVSWLALRGVGGVTTVEHVHNVFSSRGPVRWLSFRSDVLIGCGTRVAEMLVDRFGRPRARVRTVLNGVQPAADDYLRAAPPVPVRPGELHVVAIGRLSDQKDPLRFVRVIAALAAAARPVTVRASWVGDGPLRDRFLAEVARLRLQEVVMLVGQVPDPAPYFAQTDVLLSTSRWEGLPLVALESLAHGRGVILSDVGSSVDATTGGAVGAVYPDDLPDDDIAALVLRAFENGDLRRWSDAAVGVYRDRFTYERMVAQVEAVYDEARSATP